MKFVAAFDLLLEKISRIGLIISLFGILIFAVLSILFRWSGESPMWIDPLVRHLVFLSAFLGGSLATSKGVHIKIDLLTKLVERSSWRIGKWLHHNLITAFCFLTTATLVKAAWSFFLVEKEFGAPAFLNIHSAWLVAIIPLGMGLICLRFFNQLLLGCCYGDLRESHRL
jgi:TRAP-type C4-dicarboxylate transport system permease small subunit